SRDRDAAAGATHPLVERSVDLDWSGRRGIQQGYDTWGRLIARRMVKRSPLGIMLHHAAMESGELEMLSDLLSVLVAHPRVRVVAMDDPDLEPMDGGAPAA